MVCDVSSLDAKVSAHPMIVFEHVLMCAEVYRLEKVKNCSFSVIKGGSCF